MDKKGQVWTLDLIVGISIFMIAIIIYFIFTNNISNYDDSKFEEIYSTSIILSNSLLSQGHPINWNLSNVSEIGLTNNNYRLNLSKIYNYKQIDYQSTLGLLKTRFDYIFYFETPLNGITVLNGTSYFGKPGITKDNIKTVEDPVNLISTKRFVIYNSSIQVMVIYLWD